MSGKIATLVQLSAKLDSAEGTYTDPLVADAKIVVRNPGYEPIVPKTLREVRSSSLSPHPSVGRMAGGRMTFEVDLYALTQATKPFWGLLMQACGLNTITGGTSVAWVYNFASTRTSVSVLSLAMNVDGVRRKLAGCRGNCKIKATSGGPLIAEFTFEGKHQAPADEAFLTPTFDATVDDLPPFVSAAFAATAVSSGSSAFTAANCILEGFEIDFGNTLYLRPSANDATGIESCIITARQPKLTIDPEWTTVAAWDQLTHLVGDEIVNFTTGQLTGDAAGNNIQFDMAAAQLESVRQQERTGVDVQALEFLLTRAAGAGDDEFAMTLSA